MSKVHRTTEWRRKQTMVVRENLVEALSRAANCPKVNVLHSSSSNNINEHINDSLNVAVSASGNQEMESSDSDVSEKENDCLQREKVPMFEPIIHEEEEACSDLHPHHIATALIALKTRHNLSNTCIEDILTLLGTLGINVPTSFKALRTCIRKRATTHLTPSTHTICPHCEKISNETTKCTSCNSDYAPILSQNIPQFYTYNMTEQLKGILVKSKDLILPENKKVKNNVLQDITDGYIYKRLVQEESESFITLTMNVDGVQANKGSDNSLWPILFVINEIKRKKRYSLENLIIAAMWASPSKPSRAQMALLFQNAVAELQLLEKGYLFNLHSNEDGYLSKNLKVFLIGACCDKPAQCLIQYLAEPTAFFGCGNCELKGMSMPTKKDGSVVSFAIYVNDAPAYLRNNERHDLLLNQLKKNQVEIAAFSNYRGRAALMQTHKNLEKGLKGSCVLRSLSKFDVGRSFLVDSLHNIYLGVVKRLLSLWLSPEYKDEDWSVSCHTRQLTSLLRLFRFPSTTTRRPRSLDQFSKYKGSELRLILLFGFSIFENILKEKYYEHFMLLVLAVHHAESRCLTSNKINIIDALCQSFLFEFPTLYTARHNVQVIHSLAHLTDTLRNFGPLFGYSTFNFESLLGSITRSCNSTRRHAIEIMNNLIYLRDAYIEILDGKMHKGLQQLASNWLNLSASEFLPFKNVIRVLHPVSIKDASFSFIFSGNIEYYSTVFIGRVRFTTTAYARGKVADDASIVFKTGSTENFGRIRRIFTVDKKEPILYVTVMSTPLEFQSSTNNNTYSYSNIVTDTLDENSNNIFVSASDIIEKCVFYERHNKICTFYKYPNLAESS